MVLGESRRSGDNVSSAQRLSMSNGAGFFFLDTIVSRSWDRKKLLSSDKLANSEIEADPREAMALFAIG